MKKAIIYNTILVIYLCVCYIEPSIVFMLVKYFTHYLLFPLLTAIGILI